ncbi:transcription termination factor MTERF5, chloroplastic-like [Benincasa hispida]|uniref:transcription termination factor MTERF5, chloroplastic-like n=1 Tax=Benincasa hispida TaxID=102211 RepID=UPI0019000E72|nr:transcription termination factor MTERF5, chloroplastic-like [Benincasa hispida]
MSKISSTFLLYFIQKRFLNTVSSSTLPLPSVSTIEFLKNSCGLACQTLQIDEKNSHKYEAIIGFFKSHGFDNSQIAKLVSTRPWVLRSRVSNNLKPKFEFLEEIGIVGPLLPKVILSNPRILQTSLDSQLKPSFCFIKGILESDEQVTFAICRSSWLLTADFKGTMQSNINVLVREGVSSRNIAKLIVLQPRAIMQKVDRMVYAVKTVKELGIEPNAHMFVHAVRVMVSMNDSTWKKKINVLKSLGWSEKEIFAAFKRDPLCLVCSEEKMRDVADFCFNTAKLDPGTVISYPKFFMCALDKRLRPRYKVVEVLKAKNLLKKNKKIAWVLLQGERNFVENYVLKHLDDIPYLMDMYRGNVAAETRSVL